MCLICAIEYARINERHYLRQLEQFFKQELARKPFTLTTCEEPLWPVTSKWWLFETAI